MKTILILMILLISSIKSSSQVSQEWVTRYNGSANSEDNASSIAYDTSGNVFVTGSSKGSGTDYNFVTIKYSTQGGEQWVRYYDGPDHGEDKPVAIVVDDSGNVFVTGYGY